MKPINSMIDSINSINCGRGFERMCTRFSILLLLLCFGGSQSLETVAGSKMTVENSSDSHNDSQALIQFQKANIQSTYKSSATFDPKGMEHLYAITNMFLDLIQPQEFPADLFVNSTEDITVVLLDKKEELLKHYIGLVAIACFGLLLAVLLPLIGLIFCICRCAGRCGAHPEPYEKRHDACKRSFLGVIISMFVIVILFGIVCGFVTNEYVEQGIAKLPTKLNDSLDDVTLYQRNTKIEFQTLLIDNFAQLETVIDGLLDQSGDIVQTRLAEISKASAIENLTNIVEGLEKVHTDLAEILHGVRRLHEQVKLLDIGLNDVRNQLQEMLESCTDTICEEIKREYGTNALTVTSALYRLPDVSSITQRIADFLHNDIEAEVRKGKQSLDKVSFTIQEAVNKTLPGIKSKLHQAGKELEKHSITITGTLDKMDVQHGRKALHYVKLYTDEYGKIRYYVSLGLCCAVLLITTCFICGLFCGFCGQKPHQYGNDSCNRVTGGNFLIAAVYLVFLFSLFILVFTTAFFLIGGIIERVACDPVQNPQKTEIFQVADTFLPFKTIYDDDKLAHLSLSDVIRKCHQNLSLYNVLELENSMNLTELKHYKERYQLDDYVEKLKRQITLDPVILILTDRARQQLLELADSEFAKLDFETFNEVLIQPVTSVSLVDVQMKLKEVIAQFQHSKPSISYSLDREATNLAYLQQQVVVNVTKTMAGVRGNLNNLQNNVLFNNTTFHELIHILLHQAKEAQIFMQTKGRSEIIKLGEEFTTNFTDLLDKYADHIELQVQHVIGQCGPVSLAFNSSVISVCKSIVSPFNGFWASIGWCVILFIPCLIFSILVSPLYRKTDPYPGPLVESESMYDTYRDNIPLANVHKKRRRYQHETYDNRNGYIPDYMLGPSDEAAHFRREAYPQTSQGSGGYSRMDSSPGYASGDGLYRPTAPSNWTTPDYSSNSNLTTPDFERPPPYYFPGPGKNMQSRH